MRVDIQWTRSRPRDWERVDSAAWAATPAKADPTGTSTPLDNSPGWVNRLCVQGVEFTGDHYHVQHVSEGKIVVTVWAETPERYAHVWTFRGLRPDPVFWGALNTAQTRVLYCEPGSLQWERGSEAHGVEVRPWSDFVAPVAHVRHGKGLPDAVYDRHRAKLSTHGWREWTEGLDASELDDSGRVKPQRAIGRYPVPDGTKTYYASDTTLATGLHVADNETQFLASTGSAGNLTASVNKGKEDEGFVFTTGSGEPNSAAWPTGTYRYQIDCTAAGADITYGVLTIGSAVGHFARVNSTLTSELETKTQTDGAYSGTGLKLASTGSVSWSSGTATDRWEVCVAVGNAHSKDTQTCTIQANESDDYTDGPWSGILTASATAAAGQGVANSAAVVRGPAKTAAGAVATGQAAALAAAVVKGSALQAPAVAASGQATALSPAVVNGPELSTVAAAATAAGVAGAASVQSQALTVAATVASGQAVAAAPAVVNGPAKTSAATAATGQAVANAASVTITGSELQADAVAATAQAVANSPAVVKGSAKTAAAIVASATAAALGPSVQSAALTATAAAAIGQAAALAPGAVSGPELQATATAATASGVANSAAVVSDPVTASAAASAAQAIALSPAVVSGPEIQATAAVATAVAAALNPGAAILPAGLTAPATTAAAIAVAAQATVVNGPVVTAKAALSTAAAIANQAAVSIVSVIAAVRSDGVVTVREYISDTATITTTVDDTATITEQISGDVIV